MFLIFSLIACSDDSCSLDSVLDDAAPYGVTLSFWEADDVDGTAVPTTEPRMVLDFSWTDPTECFVWIRSVSESLGGGERTNVASEFSLDISNSEEIAFTYLQNSSSCCNEFATPGTEKTFYSHMVLEDETTGQTGSPLQVAVTNYRAPE